MDVTCSVWSLAAHLHCLAFEASGIDAALSALDVGEKKSKTCLSRLGLADFLQCRSQGLTQSEPRAFCTHRLCGCPMLQEFEARELEGIRQARKIQLASASKRMRRFFPKENPGLKMSQAKAGHMLKKSNILWLSLQGAMLQDVGKISRKSEESGQVIGNCLLRLLCACFLFPRRWDSAKGRSSIRCRLPASLFHQVAR